jgi:hypothetical protein
MTTIGRNIQLRHSPSTRAAWREKVAQTDPSGENAPRYIISDRPLTEEQGLRCAPVLSSHFN